jgi:hypothetical protein
VVIAVFENLECSVAWNLMIFEKLRFAIEKRWNGWGLGEIERVFELAGTEISW